MTVQDILSVLSDHGFSDTGLARKLEVIQDTIWEVEAREAWPFLETSLDFTFDGSSPIPTNWPSNFRAALRLRDLTTGTRLLPIRLDEFEDRVGTQDTLADNPKFYYFEGEQLKVWPIPPATTTARLRYLRFSDAITDSSPESAILIPKRHHRVIALGALHKLYDMEDDPELSTRFETHYEQRIQRMVADLFRQQFDMPDHIQVTDPDDWDYEYL